MSNKTALYFTLSSSLFIYAIIHAICLKIKDIESFFSICYDIKNGIKVFYALD